MCGAYNFLLAFLDTAGDSQLESAVKSPRELAENAHTQATPSRTGTESGGMELQGPSLGKRRGWHELAPPDFLGETGPKILEADQGGIVYIPELICQQYLTTACSLYINIKVKKETLES